ncbi:hypothetical protein ASE95_12530 [Sphingomonas sp. Leaf231]|nr:hypothetical protein ASE95_12530 [Sphingomonas sp. Leaf231]
MWAALAVPLIAPAIAMPFTHEVDWGPGDFGAAALLLGTLGLTVELAMRRLRDPRWRVAVIVAALLAVLMIWGAAI